MQKLIDKRNELASDIECYKDMITRDEAKIELLDELIAEIEPEEEAEEVEEEEVEEEAPAPTPVTPSPLIY